MDLFDFYLWARIVSGPLVALFLIGVGMSALRTRALPDWLARYACALAVPMALTPLALTEKSWPEIVDETRVL